MQTRPAILQLWHRWKALTPEQKDEAIHSILLRVGDGVDELDHLYFDDCVYDMECTLMCLDRAMAEHEEEPQELQDGEEALPW